LVNGVVEEDIPMRRAESSPDLQLCMHGYLEQQNHHEVLKKQEKEKKQREIEDQRPSSDIHALSPTVVIASEPVNHTLEQWTLIPKDYIILLSRETSDDPVKVETFHLSRYLSPSSFNAEARDEQEREVESGLKMNDEDRKKKKKCDKFDMKSLLAIVFKYLDSNHDGYVSKQCLVEFLHKLVPESENPWLAAELLQDAEFGDEGISLKSWCKLFTTIYYVDRYSLCTLKKLASVFPMMSPVSTPTSIPFEDPQFFHSDSSTNKTPSPITLNRAPSTTSASGVTIFIRSPSLPTSSTSSSLESTQSPMTCRCSLSTNCKCSNGLTISVSTATLSSNSSTLSPLTTISQLSPQSSLSPNSTLSPNTPTSPYPSSCENEASLSTSTTTTTIPSQSSIWNLRSVVSQTKQMCQRAFITKSTKPRSLSFTLPKSKKLVVKSEPLKK